MLAEEDLLGRYAEPLLNQVFNPELVSEPGDHRFAEESVGLRKLLKAREEEPFELDERLLEENYVIQVASVNPAGSETEVDRVLRELEVVFSPGEPLFLGCSDQPALS